MNPYCTCKICKQKTSQNQAQYCSTCAYAKGVCAICGKVVQDISMYKMSEGGTFGKVRERDPSSFKSPEQLAREEATHELVAHLAAVGQVGRMPTKSMLEGGGKGALAATLIKSYGGLNAAADALGLSKRHLVEEEARKEARQQAAQKAQEQQARRRGGGGGGGGSGGGGGGDDDDAPPGVRQPAPAPAPAPARARARTRPAAAPAPAPAAAAPGGAAAAPDGGWQYDPNSGLFFSVAAQAYWDAKSKMFFRDGKWSIGCRFASPLFYTRSTPPARPASPSGSVGSSSSNPSASSPAAAFPRRPRRPPASSSPLRRLRRLHLSVKSAARPRCSAASASSDLPAPSPPLRRRHPPAFEHLRAEVCNLGALAVGRRQLGGAAELLRRRERLLPLRDQPQHRVRVGHRLGRRRARAQPRRLPVLLRDLLPIPPVGHVEHALRPGGGDVVEVSVEGRLRFGQLLHVEESVGEVEASERQPVRAAGRGRGVSEV